MKRIISIILTLTMLMSAGISSAVTAKADAPSSGWCGSNVKYSFNSSNGTLTLSGSGATYNYDMSGDSPFAGDSRIKKVDVKNGVTNVGEYLFTYCANLKSISFAQSVKTISCGAFSACGFTDITIPDSVTKIDGFAFSVCENLKTVNIPDSVTYLGNAVFNWCPALTSVRLSNSLTKLPNQAFSDCHSLKSITIPNSVKSIGRMAFWYCSSLESIKIPNSVTSVGKEMLGGCKKLKKVVLSKNLKKIPTDFAENCPKLKKVTIPKKVTKINKGAFGAKMNYNTGKYKYNKKFIIYSRNNKAAKKYAKAHGLKYRNKK